MATCPVRFEFQCEKEKFTATHNIPRSLVTADPSQSQNAQYVKTFMDTVQPILKEHEPAARAASSTKCGICGSPTAKILLTPMSWLHIVADPFINVLANAVCSKASCEMTTRQQIQDLMAVASNQDDSVRPGNGGVNVTKTTELLPCKVCGKVEKTSRCARCRVVAYCGKEHQKQDWPAHKQVCKSLAR
jgi:hypothetical protein